MEVERVKRKLEIYRTLERSKRVVSDNGGMELRIKILFSVWRLSSCLRRVADKSGTIEKA
jgi:hypothetical protein